MYGMGCEFDKPQNIRQKQGVRTGVENDYGKQSQQKGD